MTPGQRLFESLKGARGHTETPWQDLDAPAKQSWEDQAMSETPGSGYERRATVALQLPESLGEKLCARLTQWLNEKSTSSITFVLWGIDGDDVVVRVKHESNDDYAGEVSG